MNNKQNRIAERENDFSSDVFLFVNVFVSDGPPPGERIHPAWSGHRPKRLCVFHWIALFAQSDIDLR